jgi:outer membrane protein OmpA-like peptidoglycan-associated protein
MIGDHLSVVTLDGYASKPGTVKYNLALSTRRAQVVAALLHTDLVRLHDTHVVIHAIGKGLGPFKSQPADRIVIAIAHR